MKKHTTQQFAKFFLKDLKTINFHHTDEHFDLEEIASFHLDNFYSKKSTHSPTK